VDNTDLLTPAQYRRGQLMASAPLGWFYQHALARFDPWLLRRSRGRFSLSPGVSMLLLETIGAKTGKARETPLVYAVDGDTVLVVASNGGQPGNPGWVYNLRANPDVRATLRGGTQDYVAHEVTGAERDRLWPVVVRNNPAYAVYQERAADRQLPLIVLSPREKSLPEQQANG
jgi:deazaflavin-dependent oxidoreductase (nitroreductase family)